MKLETQQLAPWVEATLKEPEAPWLIEGLIPANGLTVISGRPKLSKKSWMAYLSAMAISSGKSISGLAVPAQRPILYANLEGTGKPTAERFPLLSKGHGIRLEECDFHMMHGTPILLDNPEHVRALCEYVVEHKIACVFVDTLSRAHTGDENSAKDMSALMRGVERVLNFNCAVVLVHHVKKEQPGGSHPMYDPDSSLRGSSALAGAFDSLIAIKTVPNADDSGFDTWAVCGGKIREYTSFSVNWVIDTKSAKLVFQQEEFPQLDLGEDAPKPRRARHDEVDDYFRRGGR